MHKKASKVDNSKTLKQELSFLYATLRIGMFYITVKYHQNVPNGFQVIERTRKCLRTDTLTNGRQAHRYIPRTFRSSDKKIKCLLQRFSGFSHCIKRNETLTVREALK